MASAPMDSLATAVANLSVAVQGLKDAVAALAATVNGQPVATGGGAQATAMASQLSSTASMPVATSPQPWLSASSMPSVPAGYVLQPVLLNNTAPAAQPTSFAPSTNITGGGAAAAPAPAPQVVSPPGSSTERERLLNIARGEVGVREEGGKDQGDRIDDYRMSTRGYDGAGTTWCADFASWVFNEYGKPLVDDNGDPWTVTIANWAKENGRWSDKNATPRPGDLMFTKNPGGNPYFVNHVAIVEKVDPDGRIHTIGGNESAMVKRNSFPADYGRTVGFVSADLP